VKDSMHAARRDPATEAHELQRRAAPDAPVTPRHDGRDYLGLVSIGTNPHYRGEERRVEAFLLDYEGDLYGQRLVVELWKRLRDERAFESEEELVEQIDRDVEETREAERPC